MSPDKPGMQKSRAGQSVSDETVALYTAAKGFLVAEWIGALLMLYSFTHLYVFGLRPGSDARAAVAVGVAALVVGAVVFWGARRTYMRLDFPWRRRWEVAATVFAGAAAVFWLMFALAVVLVWQGIPVF